MDKNKFSVTALTIGSITPDFDYFLFLGTRATYGHTWLGMLWFDLPLAIILFDVFNKVVKKELILNLPAFLYRRFFTFMHEKNREYSTKRILVVVLSLLIGIASHLIWDKLTHKSSKFGEYPIEFYPLLWDLNSLIGGVMIVLIIWQMPKVDIVSKKVSFLFWFVLLSIISLFIVVRSHYVNDIRALVVVALSGFFFGLVITSLVSKLRRRMQNI